MFIVCWHWELALGIGMFSVLWCWHWELALSIGMFSVHCVLALRIGIKYWHVQCSFGAAIENCTGCWHCVLALGAGIAYWHWVLALFIESWHCLLALGAGMIIVHWRYWNTVLALSAGLAVGHCNEYCHWVFALSIGIECWQWVLTHCVLALCITTLADARLMQGCCKVIPNLEGRCPHAFPADWVTAAVALLLAASTGDALPKTHTGWATCTAPRCTDWNFCCCIETR